MPSFPNGCHICEVEIDPETGAVELDLQTIVNDIATVINSLLAKRRIQGGVAQGAEQRAPRTSSTSPTAANC